MILSFFVSGLARPKGSKRAFALRKKGVGYTGRVALVESAGAPLKAWERDIRFAAAARMGGSALLEGPICLDLTFTLPKPKAAPKSRVTWPIKRPDVDKLARAVIDALTGVMVRDDSQIIRLVAVKVYGDPPGVRIRLSEGEA